MRLIDADVLRAVKFHALPYTHIHALGAEPQSYEMGWNDAVDAIMDCAPTVGSVRHGHWVSKGFEPLRCSECGIMVDVYNGIPWANKSFRYCPYCGAKMDEVEDDNNN